jgi:hypothetical protein
MAKIYKILGQSSPSATTATTLYTVPSSTSAVVSTITVCNFGSTSATYRISARMSGNAQENQHYIAYDSTVPSKDTITLTLGVTLASSDVLTVYASSASVSFNAFGSEIV